jgi:hypothetical protein
MVAGVVWAVKCPEVAQNFGMQQVGGLEGATAERISTVCYLLDFAVLQFLYCPSDVALTSHVTWPMSLALSAFKEPA